MTEVIHVPAIGVSITANVDGDRQVVFQTAIDPAQTDAEVNALLDRLMGFASRQKLIHDIVGMRKDLKQMSLDMDRFTIQEADTKLRQGRERRTGRSDPRMVTAEESHLRCRLPEARERH